MMPIQIRIQICINLMPILMRILPQGTDTDRPDPYRYALDAHSDPDQDPDAVKQCGSNPIRIRIA
jgi:hypothetical protein